MTQPLSDQQPTSPEHPTVDQPVVQVITVDAIYQDGILKPLSPIDLPSDTPVLLRIIPQSNGTTAPQASLSDLSIDGLIIPSDDVTTPPSQASADSFNIRTAMNRRLAEQGLLASFTQLDLALIIVALLIYGITHFVNLTQFPIYFFSDEAIEANIANDLLQHGLHDQTGVFLPPYFRNVDKWNLSLSVYVHVLSVALFGKSVFVTRATSVVVSVLAIVAVMLTLKLIFNNRFWWTGALVLAATPTWFLHSRTAFETVMMVAFYACFLCAYLLYRYRSPRYLALALLFGAATFYSYANGQGVMLISGTLLLCSDLRYHLRQRQSLITCVALLLLLAVPYVRLHILYPNVLQEHFQVLDSYWLRPIPIGEKFAMFGRTYFQGISPSYWFFPNDIDLERHRMKGMGHEHLLFLPFFLIGLWVCIRHWRSPAHRTVLVAMLAAPFSAALASILITRVLAMVIPITLLVCLGFDQVFSWIRGKVAYLTVAIGVGAVLCVMSFVILHAALVDGPTWYTNYGLYGMQYGATQVFSAIPEELTKSPDTQILLSPNWANNPGAFVDFFLNEGQKARVQLTGIDGFMMYKGDLEPNQLFVLSGEEYEHARASQKFILQPAERVLFYPDGKPGFYFVHLKYVDNVDALFAAEREARRQLKQTVVSLDGQNVLVRHSQLDIGAIPDLFDHNINTLIRGFEANPLVLELNFSAPRRISSLSMDFAKMDFSVTVEVTPADGTRSLRFTNTYRGLPGEPHVDFALPNGPYQVSKLRLEIMNINDGEISHVHVRELALH